MNILCLFFLLKNIYILHLYFIVNWHLKKTGCTAETKTACRNTRCWNTTRALRVHFLHLFFRLSLSGTGSRAPWSHRDLVFWQKKWKLGDVLVRKHGIMSPCWGKCSTDWLWGWNRTLEIEQTSIVSFATSPSKLKLSDILNWTDYELCHIKGQSDIFVKFVLKVQGVGFSGIEPWKCRSTNWTSLMSHPSLRGLQKMWKALSWANVWFVGSGLL